MPHPQRSSVAPGGRVLNVAQNSEKNRDTKVGEPITEPDLVVPKTLEVGDTVVRSRVDPGIVLAPPGPIGFVF